jgi:hypothetical protein
MAWFVRVVSSPPDGLYQIAQLTTNISTWIIAGEKGEIRALNQQSASVNVGAGTMVLEVHDFTTGKVEDVPLQYDDYIAPLGERGRNIGKLYDLYAEGKLDEYNVASFAKAVVRHKQIDAILYA